MFKKILYIKIGVTLNILVQIIRNIIISFIFIIDYSNDVTLGELNVTIDKYIKSKKKFF